MVKIAIIGTGQMSQVHHIKGALGLSNAKLIALCDNNEKNLNDAVKLYSLEGKVKLYTDYRKLALDPDIDAAVVVTPDKTHRDITVTLLEAGKHVLCEKPMALCVEDCEAMIAASKKTGKKLMVGQICRYTPGFLKAKQLISDGVIGDIFFAESEYAHDYCEIGGAGNWRVDPDRYPILGGGCHAVDLLRFTVGEPTEVFAYSNHKMLPDWPVNDCTVSVIKFTNGAIGKIMCSIGCKRDYTMRTLFYGSRGTIICDNTSPYLTLYESEIKENGEVGAGGVPRQIPVDVNSHNSLEEITEFCNIIDSNAEVITTGSEGATTVATCLAMVESARTGLPVKLDRSRFDL